jgi:hypothetical protein
MRVWRHGRHKPCLVLSKHKEAPAARPTPPDDESFVLRRPFSGVRNYPTPPLVLWSSRNHGSDLGVAPLFG